MFEHVKQANQTHDALTKDAATEEQAKEQLSRIQEEEQQEDKKPEEDVTEDVIMQGDEKEEAVPALDTLEPDNVNDSKKKGRKRGDPKPIDDELEITPMEGRVIISVQQEFIMLILSFLVSQS